MLSNSSKRKASSLKGLQKVGFHSNLFYDVVTSGELAWKILSLRKRPYMTYSKSPKVFVIGNGDDDEEYIKSSGCEFATPENADFVLARGTFSVHNGNQRIFYKRADELMTDIDSWLKRCQERKLPMIVSNPDFHRPGSNSPMPGQIGKKYSLVADCQVEYIGKPYSAVYDACFASFALNNSSFKNPEDFNKRTVAIGDSLHHDILGAINAGIDSVWTANGVHCSEIGTAEGSAVMPKSEIVEKFLIKENIFPTNIMPMFKW